MQQGQQTKMEMQKENLKSEGTKERQEIIKRKDSQGNKSRHSKQEHLKNDRHQGNKGEN